MRVEQQGDVAVVHIEGGKANAMNPAMLEALDGCLDQVEQANARAMVLTGYERFFSAGLDLASLHELDRHGMAQMMERFDAVMRRLFTWPGPVVAAVNGHAIAGGLVLALQADERYCANTKLSLCLKEVVLGVGLPSAVIEPLRLAVAPPHLVPLALEGRSYDPSEGVACGLIQQVVAQDRLVGMAVKRAQELADLPGLGFAHIKEGLRRRALADWEASADASLDLWLDTWFHPRAVEVREATLAAMSK
ncbi:MAG: enoyl-CoA hydratase/isomerase family protein [Thermoplasmatota archaeon]